MIPEFRRIMKEDLQGAPAWISGLLTPLNLFMEQVYSTFNGNIVLNQNVNSTVYTSQFTTPSNYSDGANANFSPFSFNFSGLYLPSCVLVGSISKVSSVPTPIIKPVHIDWTLSTSLNNSANVITVNYLTGLTASTKYNVTLLCL